MATILFLASNPLDTTSLRLDEELRAIDRKLRQSEFRDMFDIEQHWAVRVSDLQECLLRHKPNIVHFSGHGSKSSQIILQDNLGNSHPVSVKALSNLFSVLKDNIQCVVLNACYSEKQALAIAKHIECVVGMSQAVTDQAAISFASSFYQALGYGRSVKTAFDLGCGQIDMEGFDEQDTPKLLTLNNDPNHIFFHPPPDQSLTPEPMKSSIRFKQIMSTSQYPLIESSERLITIGRAPQNMIQISDQKISWEHGQITLMQGGYFYRHLSKSNPSILRRKGEEYLLRVGLKEEMQLRSQDRLIIGDTILVVEFDLINEGVGYTTTARPEEKQS